MKTKYIYKLVHNRTHEVLHVGETVQPKVRFYQHTKGNPKFAGHGKFKGIDCRMVIIESCHRDMARIRQEYWQKFFGLETDNEKLSKAGLGRKTSEETKRRISESQKGIPKNRSCRRKN